MAARYRRSPAMIWKRRPAWADEDGLQHALLAHRRDQLGQVAHVLPRLMRVGLDVFDGDHAADGLAAGPAELVDEVQRRGACAGFPAGRVVGG